MEYETQILKNTKATNVELLNRIRELEDEIDIFQKYVRRLEKDLEKYEIKDKTFRFRLTYKHGM